MKITAHISLKAFLPYLCLLLLVTSACTNNSKNKETQQNPPPTDSTKKITPIDWRNEVVYHVMPRSFYDSNGDLHGDLNGFVEKLDYLQQLGVTTILFTPLYESGFYHNYFPTNYENIDQEYGTKEDYINFVKAVHQRGMKFLMDMETQYAQNGNIWFDDSYKNPTSKYADFIYYNDSLNQVPDQIFMPAKAPLRTFKAWPNKEFNIVYLNLNHAKVKQYMIDFYAYWVDPNQDGNFDDGVDGFRIDHIMDDLDKKKVFTNMYQDFWKPIFQKCKEINPNVMVLGEQADWNTYGADMIKRSGADAAFNFKLLFALMGSKGTHDMYLEAQTQEVKMEPQRIHEAITESSKRVNGENFLINFLENHDTKRWASVVNGNSGQMRIAAVMNLLLPGVPSIYYGQELGVTGIVGKWDSDVNHIPVREAFPWTTNPDAKGTAIFYKNTGAWWDQSFHQTDALKKLALTTQQKDSASLWHHYRQLIALRKQNAAFCQGSYEPLSLQNKQLLGFKRTLGQDEFTVLINLSDQVQKIPVETIKDLKVVMGKAITNATLEGYQFVVLRK